MIEVVDSSQSYTAFRFLYPVRAGLQEKTPPALLGFWEKKGWVAQVKKDGTSNVLAVAPPDATGVRKLLPMKRDGAPHTLWQPTAASAEAFLSLPGKGWWVFVAELMHSKVAGGPKDTNYLHDCLVADGRYLVGSRYADRYDRLTDAFPIVGETTDALKVNDNTFILANFENDFSGLFKSLAERDEGLVLKDPNARLKLCIHTNSNRGAQVKCRKTHARSGSF
jgi:hypothetical protein